MAIPPDVCHLPIDQTLLPLNGGYLDLEIWSASSAAPGASRAGLFNRNF